MKYNAKYDRWFSKEGLVYRYDEKKDRLVECKLTAQPNLYLVCHCKFGNFLVHRAIWETFKGAIPENMEIDHVKGNQQDNRLKMLRLVTHAQNSANLHTRKRCWGKFAKLFYEHYGCTDLITDSELYYKEKLFYNNHGHCRWEEESRELRDFGVLFYNIYKMYKRDNRALYEREYKFYKRHGYLKGEIK